MTSRFWWTSALLAGVACAAFVLWRSFHSPLGFAAQQVALTNATSLDVWIAYAPSRLLEFIAQPTSAKP